MSHEFESGLFVGTAAWHGLGVTLENAPDNIEEALRIAGLDWSVELEPIFLRDGTLVEEKKAVIRSTDRSILGVVGNRFRPLQNLEAFRFFNSFLEVGQARIETCGSLYNGRRIFVLVRLLVDDVDVAKGDTIRPYLALAHGHDGTLVVTVMFTAVRIVCANTLGAALSSTSNDGSSIRLRHTKSLPIGLEKAQDTISLAKQSWDISVDAFKRMAKTAMTGKEFATYAKKVFSVNEDIEELPKKTQNMLDILTETYDNGPGLTSHTRGTIWAGYNAITSYLDHTRGRTAESRLDSTWFGASSQTRARALEIAFASQN